MSVSIFWPDIPEIAVLVEAVRRVDGCAVAGPRDGYWIVDAGRSISLRRKDLGLGPALWNSALSGGFRGRLVTYDRDVLCIESED